MIHRLVIAKQLVNAARLLAELTATPNPWVLYHGSNSEKFEGKIRTGQRDFGWFGSGLYLTAYEAYAKRWGKYIYKMEVPPGKFAEAKVTGDYEKVEFFGDAEKADVEAGERQQGVVMDEEAWSNKFTANLKKRGYDGIRVAFDNHKDVEVCVFNTDNIKVVGRLD